MSKLLKYTRNTRELLPGSCRFIRSDVPTRLAPGDMKWLLEHEVTTIIDLRTDVEREQRPCPLQKKREFQYFCMPLTGGGSIPETPEDVALSYIKMVDDNLYKVLDLIKMAKTNVLYFCNAGKDRTGVVSAMLLRDAGISDAYIIDDYMKSYHNLASVLEEYAQQNPEIDLDVITPHPEYMQKFLKLLGEKEIAVLKISRV